MSKNLDVSYLLDFYGDMLTEKQKTVMVQYYNDDLSLSEIAENFGISRQGVRDSIKRGEATLFELEDKIGYAAKFQLLQKSVEQIEQLAKGISFCNSNNYVVSDEISRNAVKIISLAAKISE